MKTNTEALLEDLIAHTKANIDKVRQFQQKGLEELNFKSDSDSWSVLECIEHLNRYGDFYLPEIKKRITESSAPPEAVFTSRFLGNYFAESMLPKEKLNKVKTFKKMNPAGSKLDKKVLDHFLDQQDKMLELLDKARRVSLSKTKTSISISKWIKLKLGDTFRVVIYHNMRHMVQAEKAVKNYKVKIS